VRLRLAALVVSTCATGATPALAEAESTVSLSEALRAARATAPDLVVARSRERVAHAEVGIAGTIPNPSAILATSSQAARFSGTLSVPLVILGQRGASMDAARAEERTSSFDTLVTWNDVRQATEHAYVVLWLANGVADARRAAAALQATLESSIVERVRVGSAPEIDSLRVHAEKLRADAEVTDAEARVDAASIELSRWMGLRGGARLRPATEIPIPTSVPSLTALMARIDGATPVQREHADVMAAEARVRREHALVRPGLVLDVGADVADPTLNNATNYRAQLLIDLPVFNQRGAYIEREKATGDVARAREEAARAQATAELRTAYRLYEAANAQRRTLAEGVLPASQSAARATEEAYALGRAPLVAVLDAERSLVDARLAALEAQAASATAWADVEHAVGEP
jgi:cobalt-zinc-cadmium efflux system outer membrane protein